MSQEKVAKNNAQAGGGDQSSKGGGGSAGGAKEQARLAEARRAELAALCRPAFDAPRPPPITALGRIVTAVGLLAALVFLVLLFVSLYQLFRQRPLAGENLFGAGVGLAYALFFARVWHGFLELPDWRVALDVPFRAKAFAALGSAVAASLAAGALALGIFAVCAKTTFLGLMDAIGAAEVGKVQFIASAAAAFFFFLMLWYVFQAVMELREWARTALGMIFAASIAAAVAGVLLDVFALSDVIGNRGVTAWCCFIGGVSLVGLFAQVAVLRGEDVVRHFRADEV